ncbi:isoaspartyl peptidase/L-asparaginase [soil metagenome]
MRSILCFLALAFLVAPTASAQTATSGPTTQAVIAVHGGAGTILRERMTPESDAAIRAALEAALRAGYDILQAGGSAVDAVEGAVVLLEDDPLFNAGRGAVLTADGRAELDAAVMRGDGPGAGAVAGLRRVRNPIRAARAVMEHSPHVFMIGDGAEEFALTHGLAFVPNSYFITPSRLQALENVQRAERESEASSNASPIAEPWQMMGTVGAVAVDADGLLAAATSTGGMTNKRFGRVGDVPVIGAGTYADNQTCAVSATGHGEYFIRGVVAHDVAARMRYAGESLDAAAQGVVHHTLVEAGGSGGVIAIDRAGNVSMPHNSPGMYRGYITAQGQVHIYIFADEGGPGME